MKRGNPNTMDNSTKSFPSQSSQSVRARWIIGIDEAGRGSLAGPVAVGLVAIQETFDLRLIVNVRDSKQLTANQREEWFVKMKEWNKEESFYFKATLVSAKIIDREGIVKAVQKGINRLLRDFPRNTSVLLDGRLRAPRRFEDQTTIIKGDEKEPVISLASIAAKVTRDRYMTRLAKKYPPYGFESHKGYGTEAHYRALEGEDICEIHRKTFLTKYFNNL